ncbi:MAG: Jag N-terminal domain-containing protein [Clostridiales Family XIII bacterium]|jgi:spoIIIJ-associated protein|nr:Jag N-terminal domain-containing protein [Clostridiales Family XIII bacterium]
MKKNNRRHVPQPRRIELDYSEKWGKDVEEATRLALADLKISEDEAVVTVLEQPTKGFLGIGAKLAKVRVEKSEQTETEQAAQESAREPARTETAVEGESLGIGKVRDLRKNKGENASAAGVSGGAGRSSGGRSGRSGRDRSERRDDRSEGRERSDRRGGRRERGHGGERSEKRTHTAEESKNESRSYWISSEGADKPNRPEPANRPAPDRAEKRDRPDGRQPAAAHEERFSFNDRPADLRPVSEGNAAEAFFRELVNKMGLDVCIRALENDECVYLEVEGKDSRTVIGKRGQTLDAIQYLTNLVMNKTQEKYIRVVIDVEGYRSRREKTLEHLAVKLARKVERTGRNMRLEPMNPYERKVIHATLQSNEGITTRSEGEEPYRHVIIERK